MRLHADTVLLTRRRLLVWTAGAAFPRWVYASATAFWNVKAPSNWTDDEIRQLLTKSPWSKQVTIKVVDSQVPPQRSRPVGIEPQ